MKDKKELKQEYKERKITGGVFIIKNNVNGRIFLKAAADLNGSKNLFEFSKLTGSPPHLQMSKEWKEFGMDSFSFEVLEEIEKKETQTIEEFIEDIKLLEEIWQEKLSDSDFY